VSFRRYSDASFLAVSHISSLGPVVMMVLAGMRTSRSFLWMGDVAKMTRGSGGDDDNDADDNDSVLILFVSS